MTRHSNSNSRRSALRPRVLLVATNRWSLAARLASGLLQLGCEVAAVCPTAGHPIRKVRGIKCLYPYAPRTPLASLRAAIEQFGPQIIVPLCDRSVQHLHQLHAECNGQDARDGEIRELIERSLGPASSFSIVSSRYDLLMLAKNAGIPVPQTIQVNSLDDLEKWQSRLPFMLKADGTSCGLGVRRADTVKDASKALQQLTARMSAFAFVKKLLLYRDRAWTIANRAAARPGVVAQAVVAGRPANCTCVCWRGELLAGIAVEVVQADGPMEPAIVVEVVEGREMLNAARLIARQLELTGFFGLDFILEEATGNFYLIEMNPRCTPPCTLNLGEDRDLLASFWAKVTNQQVPRRPAATRKTRIAYFPTAVMRGIANMGVSPSFYLDVPREQPELVDELLHPWSEMSLAGSLLYAVRRNLPFKQHIRRMLRRSPNANNLSFTARRATASEPKLGNLYGE